MITSPDSARAAESSLGWDETAGLVSWRIAGGSKFAVRMEEANITAGPFALKLSAAQTLALLALAGSAGDDGFAFSRGGDPGLGDAIIRARPASWTLKTRPVPNSFGALRRYPLWSSWHTSSQGVATLPPSGTAFAAANLSASLQPEDAATPSGATPLWLTRRWERVGGGSDGALALRFTVTNRASEAVEIGAFGFALPFPWQAGSAAGDAASTFLDPAIGGEHGYATVTRLSGKREVLMVSPGHDRSGQLTSLEAWTTHGSGVSPLAYWLAHSKAYAQAEGDAPHGIRSHHIPPYLIK